MTVVDSALSGELVRAQAPAVIDGLPYRETTDRDEIDLLLVRSLTRARRPRQHHEQDRTLR